MSWRVFVITCIVGAMAGLGNASAWGQMIVYAMTGTIRSVSATALTATASGDTQTFSLGGKSHPSLDFDKDLREDSTPAAEFRKSDAFAVIYYYGLASDKTAVAVKDLGAGPFERTTGTVKHFDKHSHRLTVTTDTGQPAEFIIGEKAVVDTGMRVEPGRKADPPNGSHVFVTSIPGSGDQTVVYLRLQSNG
ncbi:MAG: hypothetical protein WCB58_20195 [Acidobacteriaceae bacterium]